MVQANILQPTVTTMPGNVRDVTQALARSRYRERFYRFIRKIDDDAPTPPGSGGTNTSPYPGDFAELFEPAETVVENLMSPGLEMATLAGDIDTAATGVLDIQTNFDVIDTGLREGTDPNGGGSTTSAIVDFRTAVGNFGGVNYGGNSGSDRFADLLKFVIDQVL